MALGDLMAFRYSQSSAVVSSHSNDCSNYESVDSIRQRRDWDSETVGSTSYGNATNVSVTSMAYLPQTIVLCEFRHEAFEVCGPYAPPVRDLVSKWRPKDRVSSGFIPKISLLLFMVDFYP